MTTKNNNMEYFKTDFSTLYLGDTIEKMTKMVEERIRKGVQLHLF